MFLNIHFKSLIFETSHYIHWIERDNYRPVKVQFSPFCNCNVLMSLRGATSNQLRIINKICNTNYFSILIIIEIYSHCLTLGQIIIWVKQWNEICIVYDFLSRRIHYILINKKERKRNETIIVLIILALNVCYNNYW